MVITATPKFAQPRSAQGQNPPCEQQDPTPPAESFSAGRLASGLVGGAAVGAGLGFLGAQAGATLGFVIGMEVTAPTAGLGGLFMNSLRGAAIGQLAGAALYGAVGIAVGAMAGTYLYDKATA